MKLGSSYTTAILNAKQALATNAAIAACDMLDGVQDGLLTDPRQCTYNPALDPTITTATCTPANGTCLTPGEATAFFKTWDGARSTSGKLLWYGVERGAALSGLGGVNPFNIATAQPQFWVYFYPQWDWHTLTYNNYEAFFNLTQIRVGPIMGSDNPNLTAFHNTGGKILTWQGWADQLIMPQGSTSYYENVANFMAAATTRRSGRGSVISWRPASATAAAAADHNRRIFSRRWSTGSRRSGAGHHYSHGWRTDSPALPVPDGADVHRRRRESKPGK